MRAKSPEPLGGDLLPNSMPPGLSHFVDSWHVPDAGFEGRALDAKASIMPITAEVAKKIVVVYSGKQEHLG